MRRTFSDELEKWMEKDPDIFMISIDLGYKMLDNLFAKFPDRCINTGASEQVAVGIAVGLALQGKKPFVYSITSFLLRRPYETIKLYINDEQVPVRLIGGGRDRDYEHDGNSHWSEDAYHILDGFPYIKQYWPDTKDEIAGMVEELVTNNVPSFASLHR